MNSIDMAYSWQRSGLATVPPRQAAMVLGCKPYTLNTMAKEGKLNLPYLFCGSHLRISVNGIIRFLEGKGDYGKHEQNVQMGFCRNKFYSEPVLDGYPRKKVPTPQTQTRQK